MQISEVVILLSRYTVLLHLTFSYIIKFSFNTHTNRRVIAVYLQGLEKKIYTRGMQHTVINIHLFSEK